MIVHNSIHLPVLLTGPALAKRLGISEKELAAMDLSAHGWRKISVYGNLRFVPVEDWQKATGRGRER